MIVSDRTDANGVPLVIHNIGEGVKEEPYLLANKVAGHFRCLMQTQGCSRRVGLSDAGR